MGNLLVFSENDMLGHVTHVDTEQIIIEIENSNLMNKICVGNPGYFAAAADGGRLCSLYSGKWKGSISVGFGGGRSLPFGCEYAGTIRFYGRIRNPKTI